MFTSVPNEEALSREIDTYDMVGKEVIQ